jgi:hypothetical protein
LKSKCFRIIRTVIFLIAGKLDSPASTPISLNPVVKFNGPGNVKTDFFYIYSKRCRIY